MSKHLFVLAGSGNGSGWWLKITSPDELMEYHDAHDGKYGRALLNIIRDKEFGAPTCEHGPHAAEMPLAQAAYYHAINRALSPVAALTGIATRTATSQLDAILERGAVYINSVGGWCWDLAAPVAQTLRKDDFVFPNFNKSDIRISRFPGGTHFYAHVGPMEVRDGNVIKWNTREEAYRHALACLPERD